MSIFPKSTDKVWLSTTQIQWKSLSRVWLCDPTDYTVYGILQARTLE